MSLRFSLGIPAGGGSCLPTLLALSNTHLVNQARVVVFTNIQDSLQELAFFFGVKYSKVPLFLSKFQVSAGAGWTREGWGRKLSGMAGFSVAL